jgi:lipopolysaccharide transport system permease protein
MSEEIRVDTNEISNDHWDLIIEPQNKWFDLKIKDILRYKDLMMLLVRRDIVTVYKQTILGPLWFIIQPVLTTIVFTVIFGNVAQISTDGLPGILFYLAGVTIWTYFADCLKMTSDVFTKNQNLFGKVYFPRAVVPLSIIISNLIKFGIQLFLFFGFFLFFYLKGAEISLTKEVLFFPALLAIMAFMSLGLGMIISSMTSKYRDLTFLIQFGIQLFMYATPVVYPASIVTGRFKNLLWLNPMTSILEAFKHMFLGQGQFDLFWLGYSAVFTVIIFLLGLAVFNRTEKNFMDTV